MGTLALALALTLALTTLTTTRPQCFWWRDRDRIVLLHEFLEAWPPMGHKAWEESIRERVEGLWELGLWGYDDFNNNEMPGYRYLAASPNCPRYLRPTMSESLLEKVCQHLRP